MIRAQLVKELRENGRYAALAAVSLSALVTCLLAAESTRGMSVVDDTYQAVMLIAFAGAGLSLGLTVMGDLRRERWGFSVHRPLSRWTLFAAKFAAAMLLYFLATSVAVAVAGSLAAIPRFVRAPFALSMLQPTIFYQFAGLLGLACGMTIAARQARWIGTRFFPAGFAGVAYALAYVLSFHWWASAIVLTIATVLLAVMAAAYFVHNGDYERQPLWSRALSTVVISAASVLLLTACVGCTLVGLGLFRPASANANTYTFYVLDRNGRPYREVATDQGRQQQDLDGRPFTPAEVAARTFRYSGGSKDLVVSDRARPDAPWFWFSERWSLLNPANHLQHLNPVTGRGMNEPRWVYVVQRGRIEGITTEGQSAGSLGVDGVFDPKGNSPPFPPGTRVDTYPDLRLGPVLIGPKSAYSVDLPARRVHTLFISPAEPILSLELWRPDFDLNTLAPLATEDELNATKVIAATRGQIYVAPANGRGPTVTIPFEQTRWFMHLRVQPVGDTAAAMLYETVNASRNPTPLVTVRDGQLTRESLPPLPPNQYSYGRFWGDQLEDLLYPPAYVGAIRIYYGTGLPDLSRLAWTGVPALVAMAITFWLTRRRGDGRGRTLTWMALAALFGLYAPLTLICLRRRPARVPCPACGRPRRVDGERCEHCAAAWPVPGDPATDVFENARRDAA